MTFNGKNPDVGHRERLKERFRNAAGAGMHDYEILELLLTYAVPRRDVKPIAKRLIAFFKNINGVLDADQMDLENHPGIGPNSAALIKLVKELCALYLAGKMEKRDLVTSPEGVVQFSRMKLAGLPHEAFMALFLTVQNEILAHEIVNEGTVDHVAVYPRRIVEKALTHHAAGLIVVHNHPSGYTDPSDEDKRLTRSLKAAAHLLNIRLLDHVIVAQSGYFSFLDNGLI